jgi:hypothetical protein
MAKKDKALPEPIVLTGRVFLDGFLAQEVGYPLPALVKLGDLKLHRVAKAGNLQRYGQTVHYSGFLVCSVYDGKRWRRLLLRQRAAVDATYMGLVDMRDKAYRAVGYLKRLATEKAYFMEKESGFEVCRKEPVSVSSPVPASVSDSDSVPDSAVAVTSQSDSGEQVTGEQVVDSAASSKAESSLAVPVVQSVPVQTSLFPDLPGGRMKRSRKKTHH